MSFPPGPWCTMTERTGTLRKSTSSMDAWDFCNQCQTINTPNSSGENPILSNRSQQYWWRQQQNFSAALWNELVWCYWLYCDTGLINPGERWVFWLPQERSCYRVCWWGHGPISKLSSIRGMPLWRVIPFVRVVGLCKVCVPYRLYFLQELSPQ